MKTGILFTNFIRFFYELHTEFTLLTLLITTSFCEISQIQRNQKRLFHAILDYLYNHHSNWTSVFHSEELHLPRSSSGIKMPKFNINLLVITAFIMVSCLWISSSAAPIVRSLIRKDFQVRIVWPLPGKLVDVNLWNCVDSPHVCFPCVSVKGLRNVDQEFQCMIKTSHHKTYTLFNQIYFWKSSVLKSPNDAHFSPTSVCFFIIQTFFEKSGLPLWLLFVLQLGWSLDH